MKRGLPIVGAGVDVGELPLQPVEDDAPFLRPKRRMKPRRARRSSLTRAVLVLRLLAIVLVAGLGAYAAYARTMGSDRLKVGRVEVRGSHFLSEGEVRELLGPAVGENILGLDIEALKARLRASPWVADATVGRTLPDTLEVEIHERVPLALAEVERLYLMDRAGGLIDVYGPRTAAFDLPIVRGLQNAEPEVRRDRAERAGTLLEDLGDLAGEVSEVLVLPSGDLRVVLRGSAEVLLLGEPPYRQRVLTFLGLRKELRERCPDAEHFDLRFKGRIYAKEPPPPEPEKPKPAPSPRPLPARAPGVAEKPVVTPVPAAEAVAPAAVPGAAAPDVPPAVEQGR
jgi:cell division protein FtsQ